MNLVHIALWDIRAAVAANNKNWLVKLVNQLVYVLVGICLVALFFAWKKLPPAVPLWYSLPWGEEQLAAPIWLLLLPAATLLWHWINTLAAATLTREHLVFTQMLFLGSLIVSTLSCITLVKILLLVV